MKKNIIFFIGFLLNPLQILHAKVFMPRMERLKNKVEQSLASTPVPSESFKSMLDRVQKKPEIETQQDKLQGIQEKMKSLLMALIAQVQHGEIELQICTTELMRLMEKKPDQQESDKELSEKIQIELGKIIQQRLMFEKLRAEISKFL